MPASSPRYDQVIALAGARKKVVILGGGIGGLSAAHELVRRGFEVEVFERKSIPGGKARSLAATPPALARSPFGAPRTQAHPVTAQGPPLPGEHGFRFFPGFYRHIVQTMKEIPFGNGGTVADNLVDTAELKIAPSDRSSFDLPATFPGGPEELKVAIFVIVAELSGKVGVPLNDALFFATKMWQFLTSCEERRLVDYERINWWDFIEADSRSPAYRMYFGNGITRSLVAAKARRASTKTIGSIFVQIVFDILLPGVAADRVLNGPTNDVWIEPWLNHLRGQGLAYHFGADVRAIRCDHGRVQAVTFAINNSLREVTGDYFIGALPVERMAELISPDLLAADPSLANLNTLSEYVEWMIGIQYYLTEDVRAAKGHVIHVDSPWALTSISQPQFWKHYDISKRDDGLVKGVLSVDISDWDVAGFNGKEAQTCSRQEIALEAWAQLKKSLNVGAEILRDDQLHSWFLDPGLIDADADANRFTSRVDTNLEPLLVNYVDTWRLRPEAVTRIPNFFLASDYVRTFTDLATMEAANEAARRAVNGILNACDSSEDRCEIWNLQEPEVFLPFRAYDRTRYRRGLPWDGSEVALAMSAPNLLSGLPWARDLMHVGGGVGPGARGDARTPNSAAMPTTRADNVEEAALEARASSDEGLRRLRIVDRRP
jgi:uncharacterized protein with NAD-binding domain and iron-sulfur cluster